MVERDKYLTEAIGKCWHDLPTGYKNSPCRLCGRNWKQDDFSTWSGFGVLWEWSRNQSWWKKFYDKEYGPVVLAAHSHADRINPEQLANALYKFLKERQHEGN